MDRAILPQSPNDFNAHAAAQGWSAICDPSLAFERRELAALNDIWCRAAGDRPMPARLEMTPRLLKDCLPHVAFLERVPREDGHRYRVRLFGSAYQPIFGELTGRFLDDGLPPAVAPLWHAALDAVFGYGAPLRIAGRSEVPDKEFFAAEYFAAPLTDPAGNPSFAMAVGYYRAGHLAEDPAAVTPYRFGRGLRVG
jgi:hypothetical protein